MGARLDHHRCGAVGPDDPDCVRLPEGRPHIGAERRCDLVAQTLESAPQLFELVVEPVVHIEVSLQEKDLRAEIGGPASCSQVISSFEAENDQEGHSRYDHESQSDDHACEDVLLT